MQWLFSPLRSLIADERAAILSLDLLLVAGVVVLGGTVALVATRDAAIGELSDLAGAFQDFNQCYAIHGTVGHSGETCGMDFDDAVDFCDDPDDVAGGADNCIVFDAAPTDECEKAESIALFDF